jgi:hypothetical protein
MSTAVIESNGKPGAGAVIAPSVNDLAKSLYGGKTDQPAPVSTEKPASAAEQGTQPVPEKVQPASTVVEQSKTPEASQGTTASPDLAKQLKAQAEANSRLGRELKEKGEQLSRALEAVQTLQQKIDGTYEEPVQPTPEQVREQADFAGRAQASRTIAIDRYGEEAVLAALNGDDSAIEKVRKAKPWVDGRILSSPLPAMEAMKVLAQETFEEHYGPDPSQWVEKIAAELKPKHLDEFRKQAAETEVGKPGPTVSEARGSSGTSTAPKSLSELLYGKKS